MIRAVPFEPGHVDLFEPRDSFKDLKRDLKTAQGNNTSMVTLIVDNKVLAFAGLNHLRKGVAEAWTIPSIHVSKYKLGFFRKIKKLITYSFSVLKLHRIEISILEGWAQGVKWAENLGFEKEGLMKAYADSMKNQYLYARIEWAQKQ